MYITFFCVPFFMSRKNDIYLYKAVCESGVCYLFSKIMFDPVQTPPNLPMTPHNPSWPPPHNPLNQTYLN